MKYKSLFIILTIFLLINTTTNNVFSVNSRIENWCKYKPTCNVDKKVLMDKYFKLGYMYYEIIVISTIYHAKAGLGIFRALECAIQKSFILNVHDSCKTVPVERFGYIPEIFIYLYSISINMLKFEYWENLTYEIDKTHLLFDISKQLFYNTSIYTFFVYISSRKLDYFVISNYIEFTNSLYLNYYSSNKESFPYNSLINSLLFNLEIGGQPYMFLTRNLIVELYIQIEKKVFWFAGNKGVVFLAMYTVYIFTYSALYDYIKYYVPLYNANVNTQVFLDKLNYISSISTANAHNIFYPNQKYFISGFLFNTISALIGNFLYTMYMNNGILNENVEKDTIMTTIIYILNIVIPLYFDKHRFLKEITSYHRYPEYILNFIYDMSKFGDNSTNLSLNQNKYMVRYSYGMKVLQDAFFAPVYNRYIIKNLIYYVEVLFEYRLNTFYNNFIKEYKDDDIVINKSYTKHMRITNESNIKETDTDGNIIKNNLYNDTIKGEVKDKEMDSIKFNNIKELNKNNSNIKINDTKLIKAESKSKSETYKEKTVAYLKDPTILESNSKSVFRHLDNNNNNDNKSIEIKYKTVYPLQPIDPQLTTHLNLNQINNNVNNIRDELAEISHPYYDRTPSSNSITNNMSNDFLEREIHVHYDKPIINLYDSNYSNTKNEDINDLIRSTLKFDAEHKNDT